MSEPSELKVVDALHDNYRELTTEERDRVRTIKGMGQAFWSYLDQGTQCRELSLAKTKIEEAVMWAIKAVTG